MKFFKKQIVQVSNDNKSVTVRNQVFNEFGISVGPADIGVINFDSTMSDANKVYQYAKGRVWDLYAEPVSQTRNNTTLFSPKDTGAKPAGSLVEVRIGKSNQMQSIHTIDEFEGEGAGDVQAAVVADAVGTGELAK